MSVAVQISTVTGAYVLSVKTDDGRVGTKTLSNDVIQDPDAFGTAVRELVASLPEHHP